MHILIVLYMGEVEFTKLCVDATISQLELADWCIDNWHDEETDPRNFGPGDIIEWYFDHYEDYSYYRQPINEPNNKPDVMNPEEDIILTPGMCAIIRRGISLVGFEQARDHLRDYQELDMGENDDQYSQAVTAISSLQNKF